MQSNTYSHAQVDVFILDMLWWVFFLVFHMVGVQIVRIHAGGNEAKTVVSIINKSRPIFSSSLNAEYLRRDGNKETNLFPRFSSLCENAC